MNKRQLKFYWVLLHEMLEREQTSNPPDSVKELTAETNQMADHLQDCCCDKSIPEIKAQAILLESNKHPDGNGAGFAFYAHYCFSIGEEDGWTSYPAPDSQRSRSGFLMPRSINEYEINVEELHVIEKKYFIEARTKADALKKARAGDWDDAHRDEPTGEIRKIIIKDCEVRS